LALIVGADARAVWRTNGIGDHRRVDRLLSAASQQRADRQDETVARMDEQIHPAHHALIQTDGTTAPHSTNAHVFTSTNPD